MLSHGLHSDIISTNPTLKSFPRKHTVYGRNFKRPSEKPVNFYLNKRRHTPEYGNIFILIALKTTNIFHQGYFSELLECCEKKAHTAVQSLGDRERTRQAMYA
jgi:hypothetical protein